MISTSGRGRCFNAIGQFDERVLALLRVEIGFERRCRRTQDNHRIGHLGPHDSYVAGVVTGRFFLFVGGVLLFINNDQCQIGHWGENSRARTDDHARIAALDAMPLLGTLFVGERGMQDGNFIAEDLMQVGCNGGRQTDFGDKQDGGASGLKHSTHASQIDRSFARSGDSMQQHAGELAGLDAFAETCEC